MSILVEGKPAAGLLDTGCSQTIVAERLVRHVSKQGETQVCVVGGVAVSCACASIGLEISGVKLQLDALVLNELVPGFDVLLGMDAISHLGGVTVSSEGLRFLGAIDKFDPPAKEFCCAVQTGSDDSSHPLSTRKPTALVVEVVDFSARFDGECWTVSWKWKDSAPCLQNQVAGYSVKPEFEDKFHESLDLWVKNGWLQPAPDSETGGIIPLMAVHQPQKNKIRPVMDYREQKSQINNGTVQFISDTQMTQ